MRRPSWLVLCCAVLSAIFAAISFYFAIEFRFAVGIHDTPQLTTDQLFSGITLMVTLIGLMVAIGGIAIAVVAVFGYGEIRQIATRRSEEMLKRVVGKLRQRNEITTAEARELWEALSNEDLAAFEPEPASKTSESPEGVGGNGADDQVQEYPSESKDSLQRSTAPPAAPSIQAAEGSAQNLPGPQLAGVSPPSPAAIDQKGTDLGQGEHVSGPNAVVTPSTMSIGTDANGAVPRVAESPAAERK